MYEFTKKEIRKKFKETEYGKKTNKWLYTFIIITISILVLAFVFGMLLGLEVIVLDEITVTLILSIGDWIFFICLLLLCYFDGKRDGAIEQFKRSLKEDKE